MVRFRGVVMSVDDENRQVDVDLGGERRLRLAGLSLDETKILAGFLYNEAVCTVKGEAGSGQISIKTAAGLLFCDHCGNEIAVPPGIMLDPEIVVSCPKCAEEQMERGDV